MYFKSGMPVLSLSFPKSAEEGKLSLHNFPMVDAKLHARVLDYWQTIHSQSLFLLSHQAFDPAIAPALAQTIADLDGFFAIFTDFSFVPNLLAQLIRVITELWPNLISLTSRVNFSELLAGLVPRFEEYHFKLQTTPGADRTDFEELDAFFERITATAAAVKEEDYDLSLWLRGLEYAVGGISAFVERINSGSAKYADLRSFPADVVNLSDVVSLLGKCQMLHNFVGEVDMDLTTDISLWIRDLKEMAESRTAEVMVSTKYCKALKTKLDEESVRVKARK
jgi:hypothetical protein